MHHGKEKTTLTAKTSYASQEDGFCSLSFLPCGVTDYFFKFEVRNAQCQRA